MIVTRELVFINFPKTGSSFVRKVFAETFAKKACRRSALNRISRSFRKRIPDSRPFGGLRAAFEYWESTATPYQVLDFPNPVRGYYDQHGKVHQTPKQFLDRRFVSVARDPLSRFCSYYHFFRSIPSDCHLPLLVDAIKSLHVPISEISPETFYRQLFWKHNCIWMQSAGLQEVIGPQTLDFINHFAIDPIEAFDRLGEGAHFDGLRDLFPADFVLLNYERLVNQLRSEMEQVGIETLPQKHPVWTEKVLPGGIGGNFTRESSKQIVCPALAEQIERDEWFLLEAYASLSDCDPKPVSQSKAA